MYALLNTKHLKGCSDQNLVFMRPHASFPLNFMPSNSKTSRHLPSLLPRQQQQARPRAYTLDGSDLMHDFSQYAEQEETTDQITNGTPTNSTNTINDNYTTSDKMGSSSNADSSSDRSFGVDDLHQDSEALAASYIPSVQSSATQSLVVADSVMNSSLGSTVLPSALQQHSPSKSVINTDSSNGSNYSNSKIPTPRMDVNLNLTDSVITENTEALEKALFGSRGDGEGASLTNSLLNVSGPPTAGHTINPSHQLHQDHQPRQNYHHANHQLHPLEALQHHSHGDHHRQGGHQLNHYGNNSQLASVANKHGHMTSSEEYSNEVTTSGLVHNSAVTIQSSRAVANEEDEIPQMSPQKAHNSQSLTSQNAHNSTRISNNNGHPMPQHAAVMAETPTNSSQSHHSTEGRQTTNATPGGKVTFGGTTTISAVNKSPSANGGPIQHSASTHLINETTSCDHDSVTDYDNIVHQPIGGGAANPLQQSWNASVSSDMMADRCSVEGNSCAQSRTGQNIYMATNGGVMSPAVMINDSNVESVDHVSLTPMDHMTSSHHVSPSPEDHVSTSTPRDHVISNSVGHHLKHSPNVQQRNVSREHSNGAQQVLSSSNSSQADHLPAAAVQSTTKDDVKQQMSQSTTPLSQRGTGVGTSMLFTSSPLPPITSPDKKAAGEAATCKPVEMDEGVWYIMLC